MTRTWLIVADFFVILFLLFSFILFFLYPPAYVPPVQQPAVKQQMHTVSVRTDSNKSIPLLHKENVTLTLRNELNVIEVNRSGVMSLEEVMRLSQEVAMREYLQRSKYIYSTLEERLKAVGAKQGDAIFIRIFKKESLLEVWIRKDEKYVHLKDYTICAYSGRLGPKLKEGDRQAPEGFYRVYLKQLNPHSKFHLAFNLGYPNAYDRAHKRNGSYLMVHGNCVSVGCYAMTDEKIEEIYSLVESALKNKQKYVPVHIFPFKMEEETMAEYSHYRWYDFWMKLKEGYDYFEAEEVPPYVDVINGEYIISEARE